MWERWYLWSTSVIIGCDSNGIIHSSQRDFQLSIPSFLQALHSWSHTGFLKTSCSGWLSPPILYVTMDKLNFRWGFQTSSGHQGEGTWLPIHRGWHINTRELAELHTISLACSLDSEQVQMDMFSDGQSSKRSLSKKVWFLQIQGVYNGKKIIRLT